MLNSGKVRQKQKIVMRNISKGLLFRTMILFTSLNSLLRSKSSHSNFLFVSSFTISTRTTIRINPFNTHSSSFMTLASSRGNNQNTMTEFLQYKDLSYATDLTTNIGGYNRPIINWYPGHIAKAESLLSETLKSVDVVIEVRDARAPKATAHPKVPEWAGGKPRILVFTKADMIPKQNIPLWKKYAEIHGSNTDIWDSDSSDLVNQGEDLQVKNRVLQAIQEREKYAVTNRNSKKSRSKTPPTKQKNNYMGRKDNVVSQISDCLFVDAKRGQGIHAIHRSIWRAGQHVNERRARRGLAPRPLRVGIIGYPNVGKSALINRIIGRKRARSSDTPGVTRSLQWVRVRTSSNISNTAATNKGKEFELLDSPGIIPASMMNRQSDAMLLAICNSIGTGAYDNQAVAAFFMEYIKTLHIPMNKQNLAAPKFREKCMERYKFDPFKPVSVPSHSLDSSDDEGEERLLTGEDMLYKVADNVCLGDLENASRKILQDFRNGRLGPISLQFAPDDENKSEKEEFNVELNMKRTVVDTSQGERGGSVSYETYEERLARLENEKMDRAQAALKTAKEKGLELPPSLQDEEGTDDTEEKEKVNEDEIGKGMFDGW